MLLLFVIFFLALAFRALGNSNQSIDLEIDASRAYALRKYDPQLLVVRIQRTNGKIYESRLTSAYTTSISVSNITSLHASIYLENSSTALLQFPISITTSEPRHILKLDGMTTKYHLAVKLRWFKSMAVHLMQNYGNSITFSTVALFGTISIASGYDGYKCITDWAAQKSSFRKLFLPKSLSGVRNFNNNTFNDTHYSNDDTGDDDDDGNLGSNKRNSHHAKDKYSKIGRPTYIDAMNLSIPLVESITSNIINNDSQESIKVSGMTVTNYDAMPPKTSETTSPRDIDIDIVIDMNPLPIISTKATNQLLSDTIVSQYYQCIDDKDMSQRNVLAASELLVLSNGNVDHDITSRVPKSESDDNNNEISSSGIQSALINNKKHIYFINFFNGVMSNIVRSKSIWYLGLSLAVVGTRAIGINNPRVLSMFYRPITQYCSHALHLVSKKWIRNDFMSTPLLVWVKSTFLPSHQNDSSNNIITNSKTLLMGDDKHILMASYSLKPKPKQSFIRGFQLKGFLGALNSVTRLTSTSKL